jgi:hypothetical protein
MDQTDEFKKLCMARFCWPRRDEYCPGLYLDRNGKKSRETWAQCFERHHRISLEAYRASQTQLR